MPDLDALLAAVRARRLARQQLQIQEPPPVAPPAKVAAPSFWDSLKEYAGALTTPVTDYFSDSANRYADVLTDPNYRGFLESMPRVRGFLAGAAQGNARNVEGVLSPAGIATTVGTLGAGTGEMAGLRGLTTAARTLETAGGIPFALEGAGQAGDESLSSGERWGGGVNAALGALATVTGARGLMKGERPRVDMTPKPLTPGSAPMSTIDAPGVGTGMPRGFTEQKFVAPDPIAPRNEWPRMRTYADLDPTANPSIGPIDNGEPFVPSRHVQQPKVGGPMEGLRDAVDVIDNGEPWTGSIGGDVTPPSRMPVDSLGPMVDPNRVAPATSAIERSRATGKPFIPSELVTLRQKLLSKYADKGRPASELELPWAQRTLSEPNERNLMWNERKAMRDVRAAGKPIFPGENAVGAGVDAPLGEKAPSFLGDDTGSSGLELLRHMAMSGGGAVAAGATGDTEDQPRWLRMLEGGAAGAALSGGRSIARRLANPAQKSLGMARFADSMADVERQNKDFTMARAEEKATRPKLERREAREGQAFGGALGNDAGFVDVGAAGDAAKKLPAFLEKIRYGSMLSSPFTQAKNVIGNTGAVIARDAELALSKLGGKERATKFASPEFFNPQTVRDFMTELRTPQPGRWGQTEGVFGAPARVMGAMDSATKDALRRAHVDPELAREITFTNVPKSLTGQKFNAFVREAPGARMVVPFSQTATNVIERGIERTPLLGILAQAMSKGKLRTSIPKQLLGAAAMAGGAMSGGAVSNPYLKALLAPYAVPASVGGSLRDAFDKGKDLPDASMQAWQDAVKDAPVPTGTYDYDPRQWLAQMVPNVFRDVDALAGTDVKKFDTKGSFTGPTIAKIPVLNRALLARKKTSARSAPTAKRSATR